MHSSSGRYVLVFNGEIYNHQTIRANLHGYSWKGGSDTETLLAIEKWGFGSARTLHWYVLLLPYGIARTVNTLARDRIGKTLYWGGKALAKTHVFVWVELKSLKSHSFFSADIDRDALSLWEYFYVPTPYSIYHL